MELRPFGRYYFLLVFCSNNISIVHRFRDITTLKAHSRCARQRRLTRVDVRQRALTDVDVRRRTSPHIEGYIQLC